MALHHAQHGEVVHLSDLVVSRDDAHSTALVKTGAFEAIHLIVHAGAVIPPHHVAGQATLHCLRGRVSVLLGDAAAILQAGDWTYLDGGEEHGIEGIEDAALLLTILFEHPTLS
ncbi:cupin (plasmid) [Sphingomonas paeninsulae]|uniref:Cupin n=1 Tax=Sphingomonas paeninsulae TaxID=2319844 RepID=A0A494TBV3_SPHPE|nr:cupin domain-containing protein [Sphingomonas paeninsulae]AYJ84643.1 cupin [Sphingomonas paeninsulae]